jgi:hypothetical protein
MGRGEVHTGFGCGNLKEKIDLKDLDLNGSIILKRGLNKSVGMVVS